MTTVKRTHSSGQYAFGGRAPYFFLFLVFFTWSLLSWDTRFARAQLYPYPTMPMWMVQGCSNTETLASKRLLQLRITLFVNSFLSGQWSKEHFCSLNKRHGQWFPSFRCLQLLTICLWISRQTIRAHRGWQTDRFPDHKTLLASSPLFFLRCFSRFDKI